MKASKAIESESEMSSPPSHIMADDAAKYVAHALGLRLMTASDSAHNPVLNGSFNACE
jgi:hypothetical protein